MTPFSNMAEELIARLTQHYLETYGELPNKRNYTPSPYVQIFIDANQPKENNNE